MSEKDAEEGYLQGDSTMSSSCKRKHTSKGTNRVCFDLLVLRKQTGVIDLKPLKGIGRASFQFGSENMWPSRGLEKDYGYEFALTSARDLTKIDASDKRLRWFRFDKTLAYFLGL